MPRIFYPGFFLPPGQLGTTNTTFGGAVVAPEKTRRLVPQQPPGLVEVPGAFTTTNTTQGGTTFAPVRLPPRPYQQPPGLTEVPGKFTTTNTQFGADCFSPDRTRGRRAYQPHGLTETPGKFTTTNTQFGGETWAPDRTKGPPRQQPQGETLPPGAFTTTNTTFGGVTTYPDRVPRVRQPQQPPSLIEVPGSFTTTNTTFGGVAEYPARTWRLVPKQPPGLTECPGAFQSAPNTMFGGEVWSPNITRGRTRGLQYPPALTDVPGGFVPGNTAFGGDVFAPVFFRRTGPVQQPGGVETPWFVPPEAPAPQGWDCVSDQSPVRRRWSPTQPPSTKWVTYEPPPGGLNTVPDPGDVRFGVVYAIGNPPDVGDVRSGVTWYVNGDLMIGTLELPAESDVLLGVSYGADGTEFTGSLECTQPPTPVVPVAGMSPFAAIAVAIWQKLSIDLSMSPSHIVPVANDSYAITIDEPFFLFVQFFQMRKPMDEALDFVNSGAGRRFRPVARVMRIYIYTRTGVDTYGSDAVALFGIDPTQTYATPSTPPGQFAMEEKVGNVLDDWTPLSGDLVPTPLTIGPLHMIDASEYPQRKRENDSGLLRSCLDFEIVYQICQDPTEPAP